MKALKLTRELGSLHQLVGSFDTQQRLGGTRTLGLRSIREGPMSFSGRHANLHIYTVTCLIENERRV